MAPFYIWSVGGVLKGSSFGVQQLLTLRLALVLWIHRSLFYPAKDGIVSR